MDESAVTAGRRPVNQSNQAARWRRKELEIWARCDAEGRQPTEIPRRRRRGRIEASRAKSGSVTPRPRFRVDEDAAALKPDIGRVSRDRDRDVWPRWPLQNGLTQWNMWSARIAGVVGFAINFIAAVTWLVRLATGR